MLTRKKILFCIDSLQPGGAELIMQNTVNELAKDKTLQITVQLLRGKETFGLDKSIKVHTFMNDGKIYRKLIKYMPAGLLHRLIIKGHYDIEIAYMEGASTKVISGCKFIDTKKIAWVHTDMEKYPWSQRSYRNSLEETASYKVFDQIFAVSNDVKNIFNKKFGLNAIFIQNIINDKIIEEMSFYEQNVYHDDVFVIVSVGSIKPVKGYDRLIEIHNSLRLLGVKCKHYILGDGPEFSALKSEIEKNKLQNRIILKGYLNNPYPWIREADLLACVSYAEGYSSVVCESIILGTPVLTTNCSGMIDILGNSEYGLIVNNDNEAIVEGLKAMITNKDIYNKYKKKTRERREGFRVELSMKNLCSCLFLE